MKKLLILLLVIGFIWGFIVINNEWVKTTEYEIASEEVPAAFDGAKIVQVTDLHDATFGEGQERLIKAVRKAEPDVIFLTGDLIDSNRYDLEASLVFVDAIVEVADVYYVLGNHEVATNRIGEITEALTLRGVHVLRNETAEWERGGETVQLAGIDDPLMGNTISSETFTENAVAEAALADRFTLLLAHRPEVLSVYAEAGIDVVFSGHAHGGQIRIPGVGGLIAPGQGWLPEMTKGIYEEGGTQLVLSSGLGNSVFPLRIFNVPEIVAVTLKKE